MRLTWIGAWRNSNYLKVMFLGALNYILEIIFVSDLAYSFKFYKSNINK